MVYNKLMQIDLVHQQSVTKALGAEKAKRACVPACLYMLSRAMGYLDGVSFVEFATGLDWEHHRTEAAGWSRPKITRELRERYEVPVVSWMLSGKTDRLPMISSGYIQSKREVEWFFNQAVGRDIQDLVASGTPVIVTVKPGFGANASRHAVILARLIGDRYEVIDPDNRNDVSSYSVAEVNQSLATEGAATVVLPRI